MRLRTLLLVLLALLPMARAHAATTPTEAAALTAASQDHTAYTLAPATLAKAEGLQTIRNVLTFGGTAWTLLVLWTILQLRVAARMRNVATNLSKNRWVQGLLMCLQLLVVLTIFSLPLHIYGHHVSVAYGLSVQGWGSWLGDQVKSFLITLMVGWLIVMLVFGLMRRFAKTWWLWLSFALMVFSVFGTLVTPYVIDPLFNHFEPLAKTNPALVEQLERVVARGGPAVAIPPERMFLMRASDKVTTLNAYVTGFGASKRVVVWDNTLQAPQDQILLIFGHEMGHYVLGHIVRGLLLSAAGLLLSCFVAFHLLHWLLRRFGAQWRVPAQDNWAALAVLVLIASVLSFVSMPIDSAISRSMEHDADVYGQEAVHGIVADPQGTAQASFQLLGERSYDPPDPNPLVEFWSFSHPPTWLRASFAKHYDPWTPSTQPKFFPKH